MLTRDSSHFPHTVFYSPEYQFAVRLGLGAMAALYLFFMPYALLGLPGGTIAALFGLYFFFHVAWWYHFRKKGVSVRSIRLANRVDLMAGAIAVVVDPYHLPPALMLVLITVLGNGFQHGLANFVVVARDALVAVLIALWVHFWMLGVMPAYSVYFFVGFLIVCTLYAYALVRRIEELKNRAEALAQTDELTGLMNRRAFLRSARYLLSLYARTRMPMVFIYVDLDGFKRINDTRGHDIGDQVLKAFADLARLNFRNTDIAARFGGDEFVLILTDSDPKNAENVMQRVKTQFGSWGESIGLDLGLSWGIQAVSDDRAAPEDVIRQADAALYAAKYEKRDSGKDREPADPAAAPKAVQPDLPDRR
ncbi:MAG: GGDEF domain-containing protein [Thermodesulfobacteriota bacterium]